MKKLLFLCILILGMACTDQEVNPDIETVGFSIKEANNERFKAKITFSGRTKIVEGHGYASGVDLSPGESIEVYLESSTHELFVIEVSVNGDLLEVIEVRSGQQVFIAHKVGG